MPGVWRWSSQFGWCNPTGADTRCEHPCDANAAAESERIMSLPREADRYICCVPEVNRFGGMLDCEEVTYAEKPTATCDDEAEAAVEAIQDLDAYVCCIPERFGMLDCEEVRVSQKSKAACTNEAQAAADAMPNDDPFGTPVTMWDDRRDWCENRLEIADRDSHERDCSWAGCAGACSLGN